MKRLFALAVLAVVSAAWAGDRLLGVILVSDGGTASNAATGYGSAGCAAQSAPGGAGACAQAFRIPTNALLSIQCVDQGAVVKVDWYAVDAGDGMVLAANQLLSTSTQEGAVSVPAGTAAVAGVPDGGTYVGGVVAIAPLAGAAKAECRVRSRRGNE